MPQNEVRYTDKKFMARSGLEPGTLSTTQARRQRSTQLSQNLAH